VYSVLFDACVLHPWVLCQLELMLAERGLFRPVWSEAILDEVKRSILEKRPDLGEPRISNRVAAMRLAFEEAMVPTGLVAADLGSVPGTVDLQDRHVVAAAIAGRADVIVTSNLRHFPGVAVSQLGIALQSPDDFLIHQWWLDPPLVADTIVTMALETQKPPLSPESVLNALARSAPAFVETVRRSHEWVEASAGLEDPGKPLDTESEAGAIS
jgi:hypothetical protein